MRHRPHGLILADHARGEPRLDLLETITDIAQYHILRDLRGVRNASMTSDPRTSHRRSISARTAAVSSQPITLSGRCR